jgi:hypothetical protein
VILTETETVADWLIEATVGGPEAAAELAALRESLPAVRQAWQDANKSLVEISTPSGGKLVKRSSVSSAEFDAAESAAASKREEHAAAVKAIAAAQRRLAALVSAPDGDLRRRLGATRALAKQQEAEEALASLTAALDERDSAYVVAGSPGRSWVLQFATSGVAATGFSRNAAARAAYERELATAESAAQFPARRETEAAARTLALRVNGFDTEAAKAASRGSEEAA